MFNLFNGVYGSLIKFGLVVALILSLYGGYKYQLHNAYKEGVVVTQTQHEAERLAANEVLHLKKLAADKELKQKTEKQRMEYDEKIKNLTLARDSLFASLQSRPSRTIITDGNSGSPSAETSTTGVTGIKLFAEDSRFLAGEATRAEEIRLALVQCYRDYDAVKQAVESFNQK
jgi:hypothetical protein